MSDTLIRRAARALNPDRPLVMLTERFQCPRSTVKSWSSGRRRPPIWVLKLLREMLKVRQSDLFRLIDDLDHHVLTREQEPRHRTGFYTVDPATGLDRRNRLGRPSKNAIR